jgi:hypothetical protein
MEVWKKTYSKTYGSAEKTYGENIWKCGIKHVRKIYGSAEKTYEKNIWKCGKKHTEVRIKHTEVRK